MSAFFKSVQMLGVLIVLSIPNFAGASLNEVLAQAEALSGQILTSDSAKAKIYWNFENCRRNECVNARKRRKELVRWEKEVVKIAEEELSRADDWATQNLYFWDKVRAKIFPIRIDIETFFLEETGYPNSNIFVGSSEDALTATLGFSALGSLEEIREAMIHEFGHILHVRLGIPQYRTPFEEALADALHFAVTEEAHFFKAGLESFRSEISNILDKRSKDPDQMNINYYKSISRMLRITTDLGIRDLSTSKNLSFFEALEIPNPYLISSMFNRTYYLMAKHYGVALIGQLIFELAFERSELFRSFHFYQLKDALLEKIERTGKPIDRAIQAFDHQGWMDPASEPLEIDYTFEIAEQTTTYSTHRRILGTDQYEVVYEDKPNGLEMITIKMMNPFLLPGEKKLFTAYIDHRPLQTSSCESLNFCEDIVSFLQVDRCVLSASCFCLDHRRDVSVSTVSLTPRMLSHSEPKKVITLNSGCYRLE